MLSRFLKKASTGGLGQNTVSPAPTHSPHDSKCSLEPLSLSSPPLPRVLKLPAQHTPPQPGHGGRDPGFRADTERSGLLKAGPAQSHFPWSLPPPLPSVPGEAQSPGPPENGATRSPGPGSRHLLKVTQPVRGWFLAPSTQHRSLCSSEPRGSLRLLCRPPPSFSTRKQNAICPL